MSTVGDDFENVQDAFRNGDPRPLADWVLHHDLTQEQRQYVARALCGDVEKIDGRKVKPITKRILNDYARMQWENRLAICFGFEQETLTGAEISQKLANKFGYADADSVRRLLARRGRGIKRFLTEDLNELDPKTGHEKK